MAAPGSFALANAFVRLTPDATGFRAEADAKLRAALTGLNPTVRIKAEDKAAKLTIADLRLALTALTKRVYEAKFKIDSAAGQAALAKIGLGVHDVMESIKQARTATGQFAKSLTLREALVAQQRMLGLAAAMDKFDAGVEATNARMKESARLIPQFARIATEL